MNIIKNNKIIICGILKKNQFQWILNRKFYFSKKKKKMLLSNSMLICNDRRGLKYFFSDTQWKIAQLKKLNYLNKKLKK